MVKILLPAGLSLWYCRSPGATPEIFEISEITGAAGPTAEQLDRAAASSLLAFFAAHFFLSLLSGAKRSSMESSNFLARDIVTSML